VSSSRNSSSRRSRSCGSSSRRGGSSTMRRSSSSSSRHVTYRCGQGETSKKTSSLHPVRRPSVPRAPRRGRPKRPCRQMCGRWGATSGPSGWYYVNAAVSGQREPWKPRWVSCELHFLLMGSCCCSSARARLLHGFHSRGPGTARCWVYSCGESPIALPGVLEARETA